MNESDRELLKFAALACGWKLLPNNNWNKNSNTFIDPLGQCHFIVDNGKMLVKWNPLEDDGDALRLAVKLNILQDSLLNSTIAYEAASYYWYIGTRRAIVILAAKIGRSIK